MIEAQHAEIEVLRSAQEAGAEVIRRLELRLAEAERRLAMDSSNSGTPTSKEGIAAGEQRKARQRSERERSKDRKRGGQPGHQGKGPKRDPDPGDRETAEPLEPGTVVIVDPKAANRVVPAPKAYDCLLYTSPSPRD